MTTILTGRERVQLVRDAALAYLTDVAPRALCTSEVQAAFAPRDMQRVYTALVKLAKAGEVQHIHETDRAWWVIDGTCAWCDGPVQRVRAALHAVGDSSTWLAWLSCRSCEKRHVIGVPSRSRIWTCDLRPAYDGPRT